LCPAALLIVHDVDIPGVSADRRDEEEYGRKIVGGILSRVFQKNGSPLARLMASASIAKKKMFIATTGRGVSYRGLTR
jgi:hypothetical protein